LPSDRCPFDGRKTRARLISREFHLVIRDFRVTLSLTATVRKGGDPVSRKGLEQEAATTGAARP
ncbi:hypothetical protein, partial [Phaeobacter sp. HF9A]|uniref:hypothetical protein n=1 Tax=Phaeobacter sp. HF9A TaxID=2721561 RepID=UPI001C378A1E